MRNKLLALAAVLALVAVLGMFYATPLLAQLRAALIKNLDEPGRIPYQSTVTSNNGIFSFTPVAHNKRLVVTHVSGFQTPAAGTAVPPITLSTNSTCGTMVATLAATYQSATPNGSYAWWVTSQQLEGYIEGGCTPLIQTDVASNPAYFTVTGYLVDLTL